MTKATHEYLVENEKELLSRMILNTVNEMVEDKRSTLDIQMFLYDTWNNINRGIK
jgi:hypothetical protein